MVLDRHQTDLYVRPSWFNAEIALTQINKGKAKGRRSALWTRSIVQKQLFDLGCFLHHHAGKVLFISVLILATCCVGLKSACVQSRVDQLWIEEGGRLKRELNYIESTLGEAVTNTHQLVIQTPKDPSASLLHPDALLTHLKVIKAASSVTVQLSNEDYEWSVCSFVLLADLRAHHTKRMVNEWKSVLVRNAWFFYSRRTVWRLKDICYTPSFSRFEMYLADQIFRDIIPCSIITPLDCFWEGSKLLGPDSGVSIPDNPYKLKWTSLNPQHMLQFVESTTYTNGFPMKMLEEIMKRAGITSGYQEKPCLNPKDRECPDTAPNKNSTRRLDIGAELTGGCYGFASKYMHWPERLIVGAAKKNKTGHITKAHGLQTVIQLLSEKELFEYYADDVKTQHINWNQQMAGAILETWQRKFAMEVKRQMKMISEDDSHYNVFSFSTVTLNDSLSHYSKVDLKKIFIGYLIMLIFVALSLFKWNEPILSQTAVGVAGVLLVAITNAAALGFCAVFGIPFNASSTQIVPYLGLGFGIADMFLLTSAYALMAPTESRLDEQTGIVLRKGGLGVILTSVSNIGAFLAAHIIPIPALRVFCLQAVILVFFNLVTTLFVFPAIISIDLRRRRSGRVDIFCCCCLMPGDGNWPCMEGSAANQGESNVEMKKKQTTMSAISLDKQPAVTYSASHSASNKQDRLLKGLLSADPESGDDISLVEATAESLLERYARFLSQRSVKVLTVILFFTLMIASGWNIRNVVDGLELSDIVPEGTDEHGFLSAQEKYFGFYNMYAITQGDFEYPTNQKLLYEYHEAFTRVPNIVKNDNGGLSQFWLGLFRDWLIGVQKAYDRGSARGCFTHEGWCKNASDEEILGYKLMVQTGYVENPVDKFLFNQTRLVTGEGVVNPAAFYNYLSAWVCHDALAYSASQANLKPEPKSWCHVTNDKELKIPKSSPLAYAQIPFYLQGLSNTFAITKLITQVRELCQRFEARGLPNFPSGIPFVFWEQYQSLRQNLYLAVFCALGIVFLIVSVVLFNVWAAALVVFGGATMTMQLLGAFGLIGIKMSSVPAVLLIVAVGINSHFVIHTCFSYLTAIGDCDRRLELAIKHMFPVIIQSALTTMVAVFMLIFNDFHFIVRHFFYILLILIAIGVLNGLLFFPVLLLLIGPPGEVKPLKYPDRISTPSPQPVRKSRRSSSSSSASTCRQVPAPPRRHREPSLSTITEEPGSWDSTTHEIVVEPELVLETTTFTQPYPKQGSPKGDINANDNDSSCNSSPASVHRVNTTSSSTSSTVAPPTSHVTTKVTATAKFKVEVHTPIHGSFDRGHRYSSRRRDSTSSTSTTSTECSMKLNS